MRSFGWVIVLLSLLVVPVLADPPPFDPDNLPTYIHALDVSTDPAAIVIRQRVADGPADLAREVGVARREGILLVPGSRPPTIAANRDSASLFLEWNELRDQRHVAFPDYAEPLSLKYTYTSEELAAAQEIVDENRDLFDLLNQAAAKPECSLPNQAFRHSTALREAARELWTESYLLAARGRFNDAIAEQVLGLNLAHQDVSNQSEIGLLVDFALESGGLRGLQGILDMAGPNEKADVAIESVVKSSVDSGSVRNALIGDVADSMSLLDFGRNSPRAKMLPPGDKQPFTQADYLLFVDLFSGAEALYLSEMCVLVDASDRPRATRLAELAGLTRRRRDQEKIPEADRDPIAYFAYLLLPSVSQIYMMKDRIRDETVVTLAAAIVLGDKAADGIFPKALPARFTQSRSGRPVSYVPDGKNGFEVFIMEPTDVEADQEPGLSRYEFHYPAAPPSPLPAWMLAAPKGLK